MNQGTMPTLSRFDVAVTAENGWGDAQRVAMGWQQPKSYRVKGVPALTQAEAERKVLAMFGKGWKLAGKEG